MNKYEIVNIDNKLINADFSQLIKSEEIYFNATDIAKYFNKLPKDYLKLNQTKDLIQLISGKENYPFERIVKITKGGKYQGTWLHQKLVIDFARWCSVEFAYNLDRWIIDKLKEESNRRIERSLAKLEYKPMTDAIKESKPDAKPYHYSNEADLINRIVLGTSAKNYCELNNIERIDLRDNLNYQQIELITYLQKLNTSLIEIGMDYEYRKEKLQIQYAKKINKLLTNKKD